MEHRKEAQTILWKGRGCGADLFLFSDSLVLRRLFRKSLNVDLKDVQNVQVSQRFFGRLSGRGNLRLQFRTKGSASFCGLKNPYEGWKQIKIALFQRGKVY